MTCSLLVAGSTVKGVSVAEIKKLSMTRPPLPEQKKIAAILSSVDQAINATQAVIDQTRKVKEGLLQDLLTRGIGHTRFKQTEVGEIPEGWEISTLGAVFSERKEVGKHGLPTIAVTMNDGLVRRDSLEKSIKSGLPTEKHSLVRAGDLVYNTMRMWQGANGCCRF